MSSRESIAKTIRTAVMCSPEHQTVEDYGLYFADALLAGPLADPQVVVGLPGAAVFNRAAAPKPAREGRGAVEWFCARCLRDTP